MFEVENREGKEFVYRDQWPYARLWFNGNDIGNLTITNYDILQNIYVRK